MIPQENQKNFILAMLLMLGVLFAWQMFYAKPAMEEAQKQAKVLSGGEKSRVVLATILARPVNLLVLDEPTNHLDIQSREVLLDAVKNFPGTVIIVSHDRHFLREMTTRVFQLDKHELSIFDGSWNYYQEKVSG